MHAEAPAQFQRANRKSHWQLQHRRATGWDRSEAARGGVAARKGRGTRKRYRMFGNEDYSIHKLEDECNEYKEKSLKLVKVEAIFLPAMLLLIGLSTLITIYIGGKEAIEGNITMGNIVEFVIYVNMLTWPVASLGWATSLVQRAAASQKRINELHI